MNKILLIFKSVKIHETLFTLPFAYFGCLLSNQGKFDFYYISMVTLALLFVRTFGMASNRYLDYEIDKLNSRTQSRPLASGSLSKKSIVVVILSSSLMFVILCFFINNFAFYASPFVLLLMWIYPFTKRFTFMCSFVLGFILSIAPIGGWVVVVGSIDINIYIFSLAIMLWASSFDMIYHTQDYDFQKKHDLKSFASQFGILNTFVFSVFLDLLSMSFFILFGYINELNIIYLFGCIVGSMVHIMKYLRNWPKSDKINLRPEFFRWNTLFSLLISGLGIISIT